MIKLIITFTVSLMDLAKHSCFTNRGGFDERRNQDRQGQKPLRAE